MIAICLALALAFAPAARPARDKLTTDDKVWLASVQAFITKAERRQYQRLPEPARAAFRVRFWARRDPDPATPENEALEEYTKRRRFVDHYFQEDETPGVMTERGRMYMKYGPPAVRRLGEQNAAAGGSMLGSRLFNGPVPAEISDLRPPARRRPRRLPRHRLRRREPHEPLRPPERRTTAQAPTRLKLTPSRVLRRPRQSQPRGTRRIAPPPGARLAREPGPRRCGRGALAGTPRCARYPDAGAAGKACRPTTPTDRSPPRATRGSKRAKP